MNSVIPLSCTVSVAALGAGHYPRRHPRAGGDPGGYPSLSRCGSIPLGSRLRGNDVGDGLRQGAWPDRRWAARPALHLDGEALWRAARRRTCSASLDTDIRLGRAAAPHV